MLYSFFRAFSLVAFVLVAAISAQAYSIKYNLMGGVNHPDNPSTMESDTLYRLVLKAPTREGYAFLGWFIDERNFAQYVKYSKSYLTYNFDKIELTARWGLIPQTPQKDDRGCYLIHNGAELYGLASVADTNRSTYAYDLNGCISLQDNIVINENLLDENGDVAIENSVWWIQLNFTGTFEGNGFKISGLRGDGGLFGNLGSEVWNAVPSYVKNLGITDSYFSGSTAGAIAGNAIGVVELTNVYSNATVHNDGTAGGLVGIINVTNDYCPTAALRPALHAPALGAAETAKQEMSLIENAYSLGRVEGRLVGGIVAEMDAASLRNVYFAGKMKASNKSDCIVREQGYTCYNSEAAFVVENALCLDSKDTTYSKAKSLGKEQFADGTALAILKSEYGWNWIQGDAYPILDSVVHYGIQYVMNGGENNELNPASYTKNDEPFALAAPEKEGDEFEGWFLDSKFTQKIDSIETDLYGDWTLFAKWKSSFFVNIDLNGGNRYKGNMVYSFEQLQYEWSSDLPAFVLGNPSRDGCAFEGWYTDTLFKNRVSEIPAGNTEDVTVHAKWSLRNYTVTYHLNGGENHADNITAFTVLDTGFVFKEPTREGAEFLAWSEYQYRYYPETKISKPKDMVLYAWWRPKPQEPERNSKGCYLLKTKEELYWFAGLVNGSLDGVNKDPKACASLQNDIVVNENFLNDSRPDTTKEDYFIWKTIWDYKGTFTGNGHSISGLMSLDNCGDNDMYGGLFCNVWEVQNVAGVTINDSYIENRRAVNNLVITGGRMALSSVPTTTEWKIAVRGNSVTLSGLVPGRTLLVMDMQGRVIDRMITQSSMALNVPVAGRYLIRYGKEMKTIQVR